MEKKYTVEELYRYADMYIDNGQWSFANVKKATIKQFIDWLPLTSSQPTEEQCKPPHSIQEIEPLEIADVLASEDYRVIARLEDKMDELITAVNSLIKEGTK